VQHYPNNAAGVLQIRNLTEDAIINNNCNAATQPCCMTRPNMAQYFLSWPDPPISCYVPDYTAPSTFTLAVRARVGAPAAAEGCPLVGLVSVKPVCRAAAQTGSLRARWSETGPGQACPQSCIHRGCAVRRQRASPL